jgi:hypothetical protein
MPKDDIAIAKMIANGTAIVAAVVVNQLVRRGAYHVIVRRARKDGRLPAK